MNKSEKVLTLALLFLFFFFCFLSLSLSLTFSVYLLAFGCITALTSPAKKPGKHAPSVRANCLRFWRRSARNREREEEEEERERRGVSSPRRLYTYINRATHTTTKREKVGVPGKRARDPDAEIRAEFRDSILHEVSVDKSFVVSAGSSRGRELILHSRPLFRSTNW